MHSLINNQEASGVKHKTHRRLDVSTKHRTKQTGTVPSQERRHSKRTRRSTQTNTRWRQRLNGGLSKLKGVMGGELEILKK